MVTKAEIKKLAELARIDVAEEDEEKLAREMGVILDYVGQVKSVADGAANEKIAPDQIRNVLREDQDPNEPETYSKDLITEFPEKQDNYLKVKKIL